MFAVYKLGKWWGAQTHPARNISREVPWMTVEEGTKKIPDDVDDDDDIDDDAEASDDTIVISTDDDDDNDNVGDLSVELNIEELVAKLEATDSEDVARQRQIKRRLEELREERESMKDIDSTYNFNFDDDD